MRQMPPFRVVHAPDCRADDDTGCECAERSREAWDREVDRRIDEAKEGETR